MGMSHHDEPSQDQNQVSESTNKIMPSLSQRGTKLREELLSKIVPWENITVSFQNFPYYIEEHSKTLLMECVASKFKHNKLRKFGARLKSASHRILLHTIPGTELYRERLVSALAREMQVPLLRLDDEDSADESDGGTDDENSADESDDGSDDENSADETDGDENNDNVPTLTKGDRVKYVGSPISIEEVNNRTLTYGQRGEVYEVNGERIAVVFNICGLKTKKGGMDDRNTEILRQALVTWLDVGDVEPDREARIHDCYIALEVLYEVLQSQQPVIVYFPDSFLWPPSVDYDNKPFFRMVKKIFYQLTDNVVMICAENNSHDELKELPESLKKYIERLDDPPRYGESEMNKLFTNVVCIKPPKDEDLVNTFVKQIEDDRVKVISECNLKIMHKVLKNHNLSCLNLEHPIVEDMILTRQKAEKVIGWAMNHYLSSCPLPCVNEEKLHIPHGSIKLAILRLKEEEENQKQPNGVKDLASGSYEEALVSAVVSSEDIGVKFDDVSALENVKKLLFETVILPMRRPELFSHGNLLKPCKGILLFGPPGTGKTLMAKALATESGANFINITAATITSMWVGETENLTRALFSYASKLAPVIIFIDEVDSLLGARGHNKCDSSRLNEFMAAWDGLKSIDSQRILVVGATNRPFDLDEAVIRRMPRRIYVGLADSENRSKILKLILNKEKLECGFSFEQLADATDGYSGSDLKNLCVAAAYRPLEEFLEQESKGETSDGVPALRSLNLNDFIHSKSKVRASVAENASSTIKLRNWKDKYGERESQAEK